MPHSMFKERPHLLNSGVVKCLCGQTFVFKLDRDWDMKFWMHCKVCPRPVKGSEEERLSKTAVVMKERQHDEAEG